MCKISLYPFRVGLKSHINTGNNSCYATWPTLCKALECQKNNPDCKYTRKEVDKNKPITAELNINIWKSSSDDSDLESRFFDIGYKIHNPNQIEKINFYIPNSRSELTKEDVTDLAPLLKDVELLSAIFNADLCLEEKYGAYQHHVSLSAKCSKGHPEKNTSEKKLRILGQENSILLKKAITEQEFQNINNHTTASTEKESGPTPPTEKESEPYIDLSFVAHDPSLLSMKCTSTDIEEKEANDKNFIIHELQPDDIEFSYIAKEDNGTILSIKIPDNDNNEKMYIRFRLNYKALRPCMSSEELPNAFVQRLFSKNNIIDFRLNDFRTLSRRLRDKIKENGKFAFSKIHIFYICPSSNELMVTSPAYRGCRFLEKHVWETYFSSKSCNASEETAPGLLAYHWKSTHPEESTSVLIKDKFESKNIKLVVTYGVISFIILVLTNFICNYMLAMLTSP